ncbi:hypothetical protein CH63R_00269 [Colletotrichum higginsianum IMI 349063]|uniref:Uncharacterized protein n=1 Tax=Colletotrichum higginsianum (strain IMI 349063) TaxID=759273 RepID=A0A1B7YSR7_COLHI|nr:hypothetical protein CH63R_00269 [Colletotrichum higginsianum IMI 349063]OBR15089.1 hypothetical protein CH63R_00269 [Colletotrichum higginsianum IMI 349063]
MFMTAEDILQSIAESFPQVQEAADWKQVPTLSSAEIRQRGISARSTKHAAGSHFLIDETESSLYTSTAGTFSVVTETDLTSLSSVPDQPLSVAREERTNMQPQQSNTAGGFSIHRNATREASGKSHQRTSHSMANSSKSSSKRAPIYVNVWYCMGIAVIVGTNDVMTV